MRFFRFTAVRTFAVVFGALLLLPVTGNWGLVASAQQPEPVIHLGFEDVVKPGESLVVSAYLVDPSGNPIYDAEVDFSYSVEFLNTEDSVAIGSAVTDNTGLALIVWEPRSVGDVAVTASFAGDAVFAPVSGSRLLALLPGSQLYEELPPYRIPGANVWLTSGLITTVWIIFIGSLAVVGWANFKTRNESPVTGVSGGSDE